MLPFQYTEYLQVKLNLYFSDNTIQLCMESRKSRFSPLLFFELFYKLQKTDLRNQIKWAENEVTKQTAVQLKFGSCPHH